MGLFSRKDSASARKPVVKPRPSVTSEAQAAEMRVRARRRLAGAVALVLTAVIVLPMLLDSEPTPVANNIPIRTPDRQAPFGPNAPEAPAAAEPTTVAEAAPSAPSTPTPVAAAADVVSTEAPGYWAEPVITPRTPRLYLWSRSEGVMMQAEVSFA
ncbi:MAG: putative rane protein, partial [Pseudomonadota bacterium]